MSTPIQNDQLPSGFCPTDYQDLLNVFTEHQFVDLDTITGIQVSTATPTDETLPWLQLDSFGNPIRIYWFAAGAWLSLHPTAVGLTMWWFGTQPTDAFLDTFDGGSAGAVGESSGPMWRRAKLQAGAGAEIVGQFPLVAGTLQPSGTVVAGNATGGADQVILTEPQLPVLPLYPDPFVGTQFPAGGGAISGGGADVSQIKPFPTQTDIGSGQAHSNMPPYAVGYLLQRTERKFYRV